MKFEENGYREKKSKEIKMIEKLLLVRAPGIWIFNPRHAQQN